MKRASYLFSSWEGVKKSTNKKFIYLFLDYDGTLSPIAQAPDKAVMSDRTKDLLYKLSKRPNCKIAIVSGRALNDISRRVGLKNIVYVGNHGFEIKGPKIKFKVPVSSKYRRAIEDIKSRLEKNLLPFKGVSIEDKGFCLAVHYRLADEKDVPAIESEFYVSTFLDEFRNNIQVRSGKMLREIRPPMLWDKGVAVLWLLARQSSLIRDKKMEVLPVYIGDDVTDEDAFQALRNRGLTIFVGKPKSTKARFYVKNTAEVIRFLETILKDEGSDVLCLKKR